MLHLDNEVGILDSHLNCHPSFALEFTNYAEHSGNVPVTPSALAFNARGDILAVGDRHGRVLVIHFIQTILYIRYDAVHDVQHVCQTTDSLLQSSLKNSSVSTISRASPVQCLCFVYLSPLKNSSVNSAELFPYSISPCSHCYLVVALHTFLIVYKIFSTELHENNVFSLPQGHKLPIHSLNSLNTFSSTAAISSQNPVYFVSASLDKVVVWRGDDWSPLFRLPSSDKLYPRLVSTVCIFKELQEEITAESQMHKQFNRFDVPVKYPLLVGAVLQTNKVIIWDICQNFKKVATLKESDWRDTFCSLLGTPSKPSTLEIVLDILESTHSGLANAAPLQCPILLGGHYSSKKISNNPDFRGFLLRWHCQNDEQASLPLRVILLRDCPLKFQCFETFISPHDAPNPSHGYSFTGYVFILMKSGMIEMRALAELDFVVRSFSPDAIVPQVLNSNTLGCTLFNCFGIDNQSSKFVLGFSNGTVRIFNIPLFLKLHLRGERNHRSIKTTAQTRPRSKCFNPSLHFSCLKVGKSISTTQDVDKVEKSKSQQMSDTKTEDVLVSSSSERDSIEGSFSDSSLSSTLTQSLSTSPQALNHPEATVLSDECEMLCSSTPKRCSPAVDHIKEGSRTQSKNKIDPVQILDRLLSRKSLIKPYSSLSEQTTTLVKLLGDFVQCRTGHLSVYLFIPNHVLFITKLVDSSASNSQTSCLSQRRALRQRYLLVAPYRFPDAQRVEFWKICLELPMNQKLFNTWLDATKHDGGVHPFYENLNQRIPLDDPMALQRLKKMLGYLAYWCPMLKQVDWLPQLVYGMVSLFSSRPMFCFEVLVTFFLWWGYLGCFKLETGLIDPAQHQIVDTLSERTSSSMKHLDVHEKCEQHKNEKEIFVTKNLCYWAWFSHPLPATPPLGLLVLASYCLFSEDQHLWCHIAIHWNMLNCQQVNSLVYLCEHDPETARTQQLYNKTASIDVINLHVMLGSRVIWPLLRCFLSEACTKFNLETLWDHFVASPEKPFLPVAAAVSFLHVNHSTLLTLTRMDDYIIWMAGSRAVAMDSFLQNMYAIEKRLKMIYLPQILVKEKKNMLKLDFQVTLHDAGWPLLSECREVSSNGKTSLERIDDDPCMKPTRNVVMYPQMLLNPSIDGIADFEKLEITVKALDSTLYERRKSILETLREKLACPNAKDYDQLEDCLLPLMNELVTLEHHMAQDYRWFTMGIRERQWLENTMRYHTRTPFDKLNDGIRVRRKMLEYYDLNLRRLHHLKDDHETNKSFLQEKNKDMIDIHLMQNFVKDIDLLSTWETKKQLTELNEERIAQQRRVVEEELRGLSKHHPQSPSCETRSTSSQPKSCQPSGRETYAAEQPVASSLETPIKSCRVSNPVFLPNSNVLGHHIRWLSGALQAGRKKFTHRRRRISKCIS